MTPNPKIGLILINNNQRRETIECLLKIQQTGYSNLEVFLLDNACEASERTQQLPEKISLITIYERSDDWLTVASANNMLLDRAVLSWCDWVWFLDIHNQVYKRSFQKLIRFTQDKTIGVIGSDIKRAQHVSLSGGGLCNGHDLHIGFGQKPAVKTTPPEEVDWVSMQNLFVRTDLAKLASGFDLVLYRELEEVIFCHKIKAAGHSIKLLHQPLVKSNQSSLIITPLKSYFRGRNAVVIFRLYKFKQHPLKLFQTIGILFLISLSQIYLLQRRKEIFFSYVSGLKDGVLLSLKNPSRTSK